MVAREQELKLLSYLYLAVIERNLNAQKQTLLQTASPDGARHDGPRARNARHSSQVNASEEVPVALSDADRFKERTDECRRMAELAASEEAKEAWRLAREWDKIGLNAAKRDGIFGRQE